MSLVQIISLSLGTFIIFLNIFIYIFGMTNYKIITGKDYSLLNRFSYELTDTPENKNTPIVRYLYVGIALLSICPLIIVNLLDIFASFIYPYLLVASFFILVSGCARAILFFTKTIIIKQFLMLFSILFIATLGSLFLLLVGIIASMITYTDYFNPVYISFIIVLGLLLIVLLFIAFSPKTYKWYVLEKDEEDNVKLPKVISLAISEHTVIIIQTIIIFMLLLFMSLYKSLF